MTALRRRIIRALLQALRALWLRQDSFTSDDIDKFVEEAVPLVRGAQRALANVIAADMAVRTSRAKGQPTTPPRIADTDAVNLRQGVDDREVYRRPAREVVKALAAGDDREKALRKGRLRLEGLAELDMQQTYAHATRAAMQGLPEADQPRYWRRVLAGVENCALCVIASTQRYRTENLNPIHPGCDCEVQPIFGPARHVLDEKLLEQAHEAVSALTGRSDRTGREAVDYRNVFLSVLHEHGEIGEVLARPRDHFTGPSELKNGPDRG